MNDDRHNLEYYTPVEPIKRPHSASGKIAIWFGVQVFVFGCGAGAIEMPILDHWSIEDSTIFPVGSAAISFLGTWLVYVACKIRQRYRKEILVSLPMICLAAFVYVYAMLFLFLLAHEYGPHKYGAVVLLATASWGVLFPWAVPLIALRVGSNSLR